MWLDIYYYFLYFNLFCLIYFFFLTRITFVKSFILKNFKNSIYFFLIINLILIYYVLNYSFLNFNLTVYGANSINLKYSYLIYVFPYLFIFLLITSYSIILSLYYEKNNLLNFLILIALTNYASFNLLSTDSLTLFFFYYEMLLVPSFIILYKFSKTRKAIEASYLMFFWTQLGAFSLIFLFLYLYLLTKSDCISNLSQVNFSTLENNLLVVLLLIGFGVKLPIWPFYGWLPKAHVEAPTNFSIFLSGVLVKFAFFGLFKFLFTLNLNPNSELILPFLIIGLSEASFKLVYQIDLKKIIAFSTVIEMHWLTLSLLFGLSNIFLASYCMLIAHAILSTSFFIILDSISRRAKSRLITEVSSVSFFSKNLFLVTLVNLLIFLGFPGSLFFIAEFLFLTFLIEINASLSIYVIFLIYLLVPSLFFFKWWPVLNGTSFSKKKYFSDLTLIEAILLYFLVFLIFYLGYTWQIFLFNSNNISTS